MAFDVVCSNMDGNDMMYHTMPHGPRDSGFLHVLLLALRADVGHPVLVSWAARHLPTEVVRGGNMVACVLRVLPLP